MKGLTLFNHKKTPVVVSFRQLPERTATALFVLPNQPQNPAIFNLNSF
jgi:hypothetical protein